LDWESPKLLLLILPALALLLWIESRTTHPMPPLRKRLLLVVRALGVMLAIAALAGPDRSLPPTDLEVAVLARTNGRRCFRRIAAL